MTETQENTREGQYRAITLVGWGLSTTTNPGMKREVVRRSATQHPSSVAIDNIGESRARK